MIETNLRKTYQKCCIDPLLRFELVHKIKPNFLTMIAGLTGCGIFFSLATGHALLAFFLLVFSGFLDTFDGSLARHTGTTSSKGAALDIVSDRIVEFAVILGLFYVEPQSRALPALLMLGSILICVTSFLVVGIFTENNSEKSFHYSSGFMERAEAFIFFAAMILIPASFVYLSYLFCFLVILTACVRMFQFMKL